MILYCRGLMAELGLCVNRFVEKGNLEILLFSIQSQMRANNQKPYMPKEGRMISDINRAWEELERAEHERELALRDELVRCVDMCLFYVVCVALKVQKIHLHYWLLVFSLVSVIMGESFCHDLPSLFMLPSFSLTG